MAHTGKVREIRERMLEIYGNNCWMGYKLDRKNPFTFHHIFEQRKGGKDLITNGAILTRAAHNDLNQLDMHEKSLYRDLNLLFIELNETNLPPTIEYYKEINKILLIANKKIELSRFCNLEMDLGLIRENISKEEEKVDENYIKIKGVYMPVSYQKIDKDYSIVVPLEEEKIEIPLEYQNKVKKKNRNKRRYTYK